MFQASLIFLVYTTWYIEVVEPLILRGFERIPSTLMKGENGIDYEYPSPLGSDAAYK